MAGLTNEELLIHSTLRHGLTPKNAIRIREPHEYHLLRNLHDQIHANNVPGQHTVTDHFHAAEDVLLGEQLIAQEGEVMDKCEKPHEPAQHQDGKPPWCRRCGLTATYEIPESSMGKRK